MNKPNRYGAPKADENKIRANTDVRYPEVRLLDSKREFIGVMSSKEAMFKAKNAGLDLIEISASAKPPVCYLGKIDKHLYDIKKKEKEKKKNNKQTQMKEIQLRPNIADNDAMRKLGEADKFLTQGHRVRIVMQFRGRERGRMDELADKLTEMVVSYIEHGRIDGNPQRNNNRHIIMLVPVNTDKKSEKADKNSK